MMLYQGTNEELYIEDFMFQEYEDQLWQEVELAIKRINDGTYGYCEEIRGSIGGRETPSCGSLQSLQFKDPTVRCAR